MMAFAKLLPRRRTNFLSWSCRLSSSLSTSEVANFTEVIFNNAERFGNRTALIDWDTGRTLDYSQLHRHVRSIAVKLQDNGFGKGQVMTICSRNNLDSITAMFAGILSGGVVHLLSPTSTGHEINRQLVQTQSRIIVTSGCCLQTVAEVCEKHSNVEKIYVTDELPSAMSNNERCSPMRNLLSHGGNPFSISSEADVCLLMPSSGTTGFPKLTRISHRNMTHGLVNAHNFCGLSEEETSLLTIPFTHMYGLQCVLCASLYSGGRLVIQTRYNVAEILLAIERFRITHLPLVPTMMVDLLNFSDINQFDLSSLKDVMSSAACLKDSLERNFTRHLRRRAPHVSLRQLYGMTELSGATLCVPKTRNRSSEGSVGVLTKNVESKFMRRTDQGFEEVGKAELGELWFRSPACCLGYLNNKIDSEALFHEGWLRSGDIGYRDNDGYFYITDRMKELIKYKGNQVSPSEVEAVLLEHSAVAECIVVGEPHEAVGQVPTAFVVKQEPVEATELVKHVAKVLAPTKHIRGGIVFVDEIPKTFSGKLLRRIFVDGLRANIYTRHAATIDTERKDPV